MKNYISVNAKYYKHSKSSGEIGHVIRQFSDNINSIESLLGENFGDLNLDTKYKSMLAEFEKVKGKKFQSNANTYIDAVVGFSLDQMEVLKGQPDWKERISKSMELFGEAIKQNYGLQPVGFNFHCDEAHTDKHGNIVKNESNRDKINYHAHFIFINYDPLTKQAPLRKMKKVDWSRIQDIAGETFEKLGFERGISKEITGKRHLEKQELIENSYREIKDIKSSLVKECIDLTNKNMKLERECSELKSENRHLKAINERLKEQIKKWVYAGLKFIKKSLKGFDAKPEAVKTVMSEPDQIEELLKKDFYESIAKIGQSDKILKVREELLCKSCKKRTVRKKGIVCTFCSYSGSKNHLKLTPNFD
jgi:FtsZ-binding cell division protein ZapB